MKLSDDDKREIIRLNKEVGVSQAKLARMYNVDVSIIERLIRKYGVYGEAALIRKPYRKYSPEFKMEIINRCRNGESKGSLAIANNIHPSMIRSWLKRYEKDGYNGLIDKKKGRPPKMKIENDHTAQSFDEINDDWRCCLGSPVLSGPPIIMYIPIWMKIRMRSLSSLSAISSMRIREDTATAGSIWS